MIIYVCVSTSVGMHMVISGHLDYWILPNTATQSYSKCYYNWKMCHLQLLYFNEHSTCIIFQGKRVRKIKAYKLLYKLEFYLET